MHCRQKVLSVIQRHPEATRQIGAAAAVALKPRAQDSSSGSQLLSSSYIDKWKPNDDSIKPPSSREHPRSAQPTIPPRKNWSAPFTHQSSSMPAGRTASNVHLASHTHDAPRDPNSHSTTSSHLEAVSKHNPHTRIPVVQSHRENTRCIRDTERQRHLSVNRRAGDTNVRKPTMPVKKLPKKIQRRPDVFIPSTLSVSTLANLLNTKLEHLQQRMRRAGMEAESNYDHILTSDYAVLLAEEFGHNPIVDDKAAFDLHLPPPHPNPSSLPIRPPIVTIMGHVDHGKTTLLDTLRSASVAKGEAGGITQHIGAFSVPISSKDSAKADGQDSITFLDTPGHAAFSAMRARGANVTDIIVLVVAADDGIMPQTREVINLIKKEGSEVSLLVAINKIDKLDVDVDSVKRALMAEGIQLEEYGGDTPAVLVSGLTGKGLPDLLETLSVMAEVLDLRAERQGLLYGHVLESHTQKGLGPVATVLIERGCLQIGSHVLSGICQAKVRRMVDSNGQSLRAATPGMAVTVSGWKTLPKAGDHVLEGSEVDIKKALSNRFLKIENAVIQEDIEAINMTRRHDRDLRTTRSHSAIADEITTSGPKELRLLVKADVSGSSEAVEGALHGIGNKVAVAKVIFSGVGDVTESDVMLAKAAEATIIGFSVTTPRSIQNLAVQNDVPICTSNIIYKLVENVHDRVVALLPPIVETRVTGEATILQLFEVQLKSKQTKKIAGCRVINGLIDKQKPVRIVRGGATIYEGAMDAMRQLKKDISEARKGTECGLGFENCIDLQPGDLIQVYDKMERPGVI